jgi:chorismate synthase
MVAALPGSRIHDEILPPSASPSNAAAASDRSEPGTGNEEPGTGNREPGTRNPIRPTNNAGGLEGGVTNGEDLRITGYMKPIATLMKPLRSIDLTTMEESPAAIERSDVCAVPAAAVVAEAMVAFVLADAAIEKFGGDSMAELLANREAFRARTAARFHHR